MATIMIHCWGGDGLLNITCFHAVTSLGMFPVNDGDVIHIRHMDFPHHSPDTQREEKFLETIQKYYSKIYGCDVKVIYDSIDFQNGICNFHNVYAPMNDAKTLSEKFSDGNGDGRVLKLLGLGCSKTDMNLDINQGIYGKPWVGEAFHSDAKLEKLYDGIADSNPIVINCGGYKGGGTAATFINLENSETQYTITNPGGHIIATVNPSMRFTVITGPSTAFEHHIDCGDGSSVNIFDIPERVKFLEDHMPLVDPAKALTENQINRLNEKYKEIYDPNNHKDYRNLNPCYYMPRFVSRLSSDSSLNNSYNVVNMKHPLQFVNEYNYDITEDSFRPDGQSHRLHITNLLNVFSIKSIIANLSTKFGVPGGVKKGSICTFDTCDADDNATVQGIFSDEIPIKRFLMLATLMVEYLYPIYFGKSAIEGSNSTILLRFAKTVHQGHLWWATDNVTWIATTPQGKYNNSFADEMCKHISDFSNSYIKLVLTALKDIHDTSNETTIFDGNNYKLVGHILATGIDGAGQETICNTSTLNRQNLINYLRNIVNDGVFTGGAIDTFIDGYINDFPRHNYSVPNPISSEEYFYEILTYTYNKIKGVL